MALPSRRPDRSSNAAPEPDQEDGHFPLHSFRVWMTMCTMDPPHGKAPAASAHRHVTHVGATLVLQWRGAVIKS